MTRDLDHRSKRYPPIRRSADTSGLSAPRKAANIPEYREVLACSVVTTGISIKVFPEIGEAHQVLTLETPAAGSLKLTSGHSSAVLPGHSSPAALRAPLTEPAQARPRRILECSCGAAVSGWLRLLWHWLRYHVSP